MSSDYSEDYILYQAGRTAMDRNDFVEALASLKKSLAIRPHFKTYESIGECLLKQGNHHEAVTYLAASAGLGNKQCRALLLLSKALIGRGQLELAAEKLNQALSINPGYKAASELLFSITS